MNLKRFSALILVSLTLMSIIAGCSPSKTVDSAKLSVVCTSFAPYDWTREIIGDADDISLTFLLGNGVDPHSFQPSASDFVTISTCDLFIYVGGVSDIWVGDALNNAVNPDMLVINLLETLNDGLKEEEITDGMEHEHCDDHEDGDCDDDHIHTEVEYDEHVWLSLKNASVFCSAIADALSNLDAANAAKYNSNLLAYTQKLSALDERYKASIDSAGIKTLIFGDRFPFRYMIDDYGLNYYAAFPGCSAETEAGFGTILFLAQKADELGLHSIMVTETSDQAIANTIISNTNDGNGRVLTLNSMQSITQKEAQSGASYLSIMEANLTTLKQALG